MGKAKKDENLCAQSEFVKLLAQELGTTQAVAKHIYMVFYVVVLKLLKEYDTVNITPFIKVGRKTTKEKNMYNNKTGEYYKTTPKEILYARVATRSQDVEYFQRYLDEYEERLRKQAEYEVLLEQQRQEREAEKQRLKEERARERRNKQRRSRYHRRKYDERTRAIERMIHYEGILEEHEKERYRRELRRRKKSYK